MSSMSRASDPSALPAFLRKSQTDIKSAFVELEWKQRNRLAAGLQSSTGWERLTGKHITERNRYLNVEPFANNRVKLKVGEGINDYINASPIRLGDRRYIATQGPTGTSTAHFYRMLATETSDPAIVIMLTRTHEAGREKCFQYFPADTATPLLIKPEADMSDDFHGEVRLLATEEHGPSRSTLRHLKMRTTTTDGGIVEKDVHHLLFGGWPDFLIPEGADRAALLDLIALSARLNTASSAPSSSSFPTSDANGAATTPSPRSLNPRVVHCSAGVGRSGTFIALDYLLSLLDAGVLDRVPPGKDWIAETVDKLRSQRMMMVQGESQFFFLYEVLRELWIARAKKGRS